MKLCNALSIVFIITQVSIAWGAFGFRNDDKILLKDISVLTLYNGRQTSSRRSPAVPQLKCVGGSAGCSSFKPQVVQCYNRGTDGYDVQWECKTDMDNAYRFGTVEVTCEGYDDPNDPYVLKGSCGLEYTLDYTKEGYEQQNKGHHDYYGNNHNDNSYGNSYSTYGSRKKSSSGFGDMIMLCVVGVIIYAIYRTCLSNNAGGHDDGNDTHRQPRGGSRPPPPGFRSEYTSGDSCSSGAYDSSGSHRSTHGTTHGMGAGGMGGGGFWSGAATGGLLGYMFGSRTNTGYQQPHYNRGWGTGTGWGTGGGWGAAPRTGSSWSSGGSGFGSSSSGTRTASGFGGTKRR